MDSAPALSMRDVVFRYLEQGKRNILDHVDLDIPAGRVTVLMGAGGCGKSTLAAVAAGLYPENGGFLAGGQIRWFGTDLAAMDPQQRARQVGMLFQNPDLQFCMDTLRGEMRFCMENLCLDAAAMDPRIEAAAAELGVQALLDRPLHTLSGGGKAACGAGLPVCDGMPLPAAGRMLRQPGPGRRARTDGDAAPDAPAGAHHHRDRPPARAVAGYRRRVHPAQGGRPGGGPRAAPGQPAAAPRAVCGAGPVLPRPPAALCAQGGNGGGHPAF